MSYVDKLRRKFVEDDNDRYLDDLDRLMPHYRIKSQHGFDVHKIVYEKKKEIMERELQLLVSTQQNLASVLHDDVRVKQVVANSSQPPPPQPSSLDDQPTFGRKRHGIYSNNSPQILQQISKSANSNLDTLRHQRDLVESIRNKSYRNDDDGDVV